MSSVDNARTPDVTAAAAPIAPRHDRGPIAIAYVRDQDSAGTIRRSFGDLGFIDGRIETGGIDNAISELSQRSWPRFLIVDVSGIDDPLPRINRLAEICDPETEVIVVGDRNDIVLYRDLQAAGVAEYFYKPLISSLVMRAIDNVGKPTRDSRGARTGKLVLVLGVRGGVGATTISTNLAWYLAEARQRGTLLLDLDLHAGDAALHFGAKPTHALHEALENPSRIDELFLERGVVRVTSRLGLLSGLEALASTAAPREEALQQLLQALLVRFRYVVIDFPDDVARTYPGLLHMPATIVLVSDATLTSVREVGRWREFLGANTPERSVLHVLNKKTAPGALAEAEILRVIPAPDVSVRWDRNIMSAATLGTKEVQQCAAMREAITDLSRHLSGVVEEQPSLWRRIFK